MKESPPVGNTNIINLEEWTNENEENSDSNDETALLN